MAMHCRAEPVDLKDIQPFREAYRAEMSCQIIHDSIHGRPGWTQEYALLSRDRPVGYGSVAIGGPWRETPTLYEIYVRPEARTDLFDCLAALLHSSDVDAIEFQSNDRPATVLLHAVAREVSSLKVLFEDGRTTNLRVNGAVLRLPSRDESPEVPEDQLPWHRVVEIEGHVAASGGILFHYNPPYGDVFMEVSEPFRRRGIGSYLVQELKRICYEGGRIPTARCSPANMASRRTLQRAGFSPCGHLLRGRVER